MPFSIPSWFFIRSPPLKQSLSQSIKSLWNWKMKKKKLVRNERHPRFQGINDFLIFSGSANHNSQKTMTGSLKCSRIYDADVLAEQPFSCTYWLIRHEQIEGHIACSHHRISHR